MTDPVETLGIVGAGTMGAGIAINAIARDVKVRLSDTNADMLDAARKRAEKTFSRWVEKERMTSEEKTAALARLETTTLEQTAASDIVVEAVFEDLTVKQDLIRYLAPHLLTDTIVATNTSALRVADIASASDNPTRIIGLHYFSPADINPLCELIVTPATSPMAKARAQKFLDQTGRVTLVCGDTPGFVVNRFFIPIYVEAVHMVEDGIATAAQMVLSDKFEPVSVCPKRMNLCGTNLAPLGKCRGPVQLEEISA